MQIAPKSIFEAPLERPELIPGIRIGRGWHASGNSACWSRDKRAELAVSAAQFPEPVPARLRLRLFNAAPDRPRHLRVLSPGHDPVQLTVTTPEPVALRLRTPRHEAGADTTPIRIELDTLDSPFLAGQSADERQLGLSVSEIQTRRARSWPFPSRSPPRAAAARCWRTAGPPSRTAAPGASGLPPSCTCPASCHRGVRRSCDLKQTCCRAPTMPRPLAVEIRERGEMLASWHLRAGDSPPLRCPLPDWSNALDRRLELVIGDLRSPAALGINTDDRPLGLRLSRIDLAG